MLEFAKRFINKTSTIPILRNVCIIAGKEWLRLRTDDLNKNSSILIRGIKVFEEWSITVNAERLYDLLKKDKSYILELIVKESDLCIIGEGIKNVLYGIPASEYIAETEKPECTIPCSTSLLLDAIEKVSYVITEKSFSPSLTGMLIKQIDNLVHFVGTDSFRLVRYTAEADLGDVEVIAPVDALKAIAPILKYAISIGATKIKLWMDYQKLSISISGGDQEIVVTTLLIQGNYPNYDREEIIPTSYAGYITVDRQELLQKLPQIMALTTAYLNYPVKLSVEDEKLTLSSGKTDNGELSATLSCHCLGEVASLSINGKFLLDFLKKCSFPQIEIAIINSNRPVRITGMNDNNVEYIVRPLVVD